MTSGHSSLEPGHRDGTTLGPGIDLPPIDVTKLAARVPISTGMLEDAAWSRGILDPCTRCGAVVAHLHDCPNHTCTRACPDHQWTWRDHRDHALEQTRRAVAGRIVEVARRVAGDSGFPGCYCDD